MELVNQTLGQLLLFGGIISSVLVTWHLLLQRSSWTLAAIAGIWLLTGGIWMVVFAEEPSSSLSILVRNLAMIGGTASLWWACSTFLGRHPARWPIPAGLITLAFTLLAFERYFPGPVRWAALFSTHIALWNAAIVWAFLKGGPGEPSPLRRFALALFGLNALINTGRAVFMACCASQVDLLIPTALTYFYALVFLILQSLVLWGMGDQQEFWIL